MFPHRGQVECLKWVFRLVTKGQLLVYSFVSEQRKERAAKPNGVVTTYPVTVCCTDMINNLRQLHYWFPRTFHVLGSGPSGYGLSVLHTGVSILANKLIWLSGLIVSRIFLNAFLYFPLVTSCQISFSIVYSLRGLYDFCLHLACARDSIGELLANFRDFLELFEFCFRLSMAVHDVGVC